MFASSGLRGPPCGSPLRLFSWVPSGRITPAFRNFPIRSKRRSSTTLSRSRFIIFWWLTVSKKVSRSPWERPGERTWTERSGARWVRPPEEEAESIHHVAAASSIALLQTHPAHRFDGLIRTASGPEPVAKAPKACRRFGRSEAEPEG